MAAREGTVPSPRALAGGVCATAAGTLLLELALTRLFSFTIWYHLAYLTISIALLGFGAAGALLTAFPSWLDDAGTRLRRAALTAAAGVPIVLLVASAVPLDPVAVLHDRVQVGSLLLYYAVLVVPFAAAGVAVAGAIATAPAHVARLYGWDLAGAGVACLLVAPLIWWLGTPMTVAASAIAFAVAALAFSAPPTGSQMATAAAVATITIAIGASVAPPPSPSKLMAVQFATGAQTIFQRWTPLDRIDVLAWDETLQDDRGAYRGWGASPRYDGPGQHFRIIGHDGDACAPMYRYDGDPRELDWLRHHVLSAPYALEGKHRVLVLGVGGGVDILNAIAHDAPAITGVELDPLSIALKKETYAAYNGNLFNRAEVTLVAAEGRQYLRATDARWDLLQMTDVKTLSALASTPYVMSESYLYTADAIGDYLTHLHPHGVVAIAVGDFDTPVWKPRNTLRLIANVQRALAERGVAAPERHVAIVASHEPLAMTQTLVKTEPFTADEIARLDAFVDREGFTYWQRPDRRTEHDAALLLWGTDAERAAFYKAQDLALSVTTDESPFFFNFSKWRRLRRRFHEIDAGRTFATGQIVLLIMLVQAAVIAPLIALLPLRRRNGASEPLERRSGYGVYFAGLGIGFMLLEVSFVQRFGLYLGHPTYALSVALFALLTFTGIGSVLSARMRRPAAAVPVLLATLAALALAYLIVVPAVCRATFAAPCAMRAAITAALLAPLALVAGTFFPLGITLLTQASPRLVPWAWSVTACAAVVGTVLAVIVAITWDFRAVTLLAVATYAVASGALYWARRAPHPDVAHAD